LNSKFAIYSPQASIKESKLQERIRDVYPGSRSLTFMNFIHPGSNNSNKKEGGKNLSSCLYCSLIIYIFEILKTSLDIYIYCTIKSHLLCEILLLGMGKDSPVIKSRIISHFKEARVINYKIELKKKQPI
jgi:hypothetical protein